MLTRLYELTCPACGDKCRVDSPKLRACPACGSRLVYIRMFALDIEPAVVYSTDTVASGRATNAESRK